MIDERYRCLLGAETRPMDEDETRTLTQLVLASCDASHDPVAAWQKMQEEPQAPLGLKIMAKRLEVWGVSFDPFLGMFVLCLCDRPGKIVLWCYTIGLMEKELGRPPTIEDFSMRFFPMGVPTEEEYSRIWDDQKETVKDAEDGLEAPLGNWLDDSALVRRLLGKPESVPEEVADESPA